ncbi:MAG TPA: TonB-dependent receptor, partial [Puia sp.]
QTIQAFAQWQGRPADHLLFNAGVHYLELLYNHSRAIEPRASVKWDIDGNNSIGLGLGLHSQIQALGVYFAQDTTTGGGYYHPNGGLGLTRAQHYVLSFNHRLGSDLNLKAELYYQRLYNVPVNANDTNTFSTLNIESSDYVSDPLVNKGKGRNYGLELSLEKFLSHRLYYMVNTSFYQSKYTALDGIDRDTRFNGHYLINLVAGKEFVLSQRDDRSKIFGINIKTIYAGGYRTTPIDAAQSALQDRTIYYQKQAYTLSNPAYFRTDLRLSLKKERRHLTTILSLDFQNLTGRRNVYDQQYDIVKKKVVTVYQVGLIPVLNYKVEF